MADPSFVLDLRGLVSQGLVRPGAWVPDGRVAFRDGATGLVWGAVALTVDTRLPDEPKLVLRYHVVRTGEAIALTVRLRSAGGRGFRPRFACPLGCGRGVVRLHLPGGATRFGCRACHRALLRRSDGPPAIRPPMPLVR